MMIIPKISKIENQGEEIVVPQKIDYMSGGFERWCVQAFFERTKKKGEEVNENPFLRLVRDDKLEEEEYRLLIEDQITVEASSERGIIWGLTTLYKLMDQHRLLQCRISDKPKYHHRGLLFDCARHFFEVEEVKKIIEQIALAKMNVLHWHLSDDQGWRIESKRYPKLHEISGDFFLQTEICEIVAYAKNRGVEIIPEIDLPGHVTAMIAAYPELCCRESKVEVASGMGIYSDIFCAGKESNFVFLENLFDEICSLFPSKRFHIGGDEAPKTRWKECPYCLEKMQELKLERFDDLQGYFLEKVTEILRKNEKYPIVWNDHLKASDLSENMAVQYWSLQYNRQTEKFVQNGGEWIYSDMFELYLDYPYSMTPLKKVYETVPHLGEIPLLHEGKLLGLEAAIWCEHITTSSELEKRLFPRVYALAEIAWSGKENYEEFCGRLEYEQERMERQGIICTEKIWWDPKGKLRRKEALAYMKHMNNSMSKEKKSETIEATKPSREFGKAFMEKFFKKGDLIFLLPIMFKK